MNLIIQNLKPPLGADVAICYEFYYQNLKIPVKDVVIRFLSEISRNLNLMWYGRSDKVIVSFIENLNPSLPKVERSDHETNYIGGLQVQLLTINLMITYFRRKVLYPNLTVSPVDKRITRTEHEDYPD